MPLRTLERRVVAGSRFLAGAAVLGSLAGSVLMFFLGLYNIYLAFAQGLALPVAEGEKFGSSSVIAVIEALDHFLIAIVLLYFAYGVYTLFVYPDQTERELSLPAWLQVRQIGQLKQVVAEVIIVVLLVLFLRLAFQAFRSPRVAMDVQEIATMMILPVSILLVSLALRLVQLHPKPRGEGEPGPRSESTPAVPPQGDPEA